MFDESTEQRPSHLPSGWIDAIITRFTSIVDQLRSRTTQPIITGARGLVYGLVVLICSFAILSLLAIGLFRLFENILPGDTWITYIVCGGLFCLVGTWMWSRRVPKDSSSSKTSD
ncbi:MAG TPA: hypothetical protein QF762_07990 [Acidimicrobiales bacterium]|nr:hypothetical protein [Acidimicrobiales bacterium]|tara:strand:- start:6497 stop:6841 length:345 start_codon:yes stop_codon:yes gene_type:complete